MLLGDSPCGGGRAGRGGGGRGRGESRSPRGGGSGGSSPRPGRPSSRCAGGGRRRIGGRGRAAGCGGGGGGGGVVGVRPASAGGEEAAYRDRAPHQRRAQVGGDQLEDRRGRGGVERGVAEDRRVVHPAGQRPGGLRRIGGPFPLRPL